MQYRNFEISHLKRCGYYVVKSPCLYLWKDGTLHHCNTGWSDNSRKYGEVPGYYKT